MWRRFPKQWIVICGLLSWPFTDARAGGFASAIPESIPSWRVEINSDLIVIGTLVLDEEARATAQRLLTAKERPRKEESWFEVTVKVHSVLKGPPIDELSFGIRIGTYAWHDRVPQFIIDAMQEGYHAEQIFFFQAALPLDPHKPRCGLTARNPDDYVILPATGAQIVATKALIARNAEFSGQPALPDLTDSWESARLQHLIQHLTEHHIQLDLSRIIYELCESEPEMVLRLIDAMDDARLIRPYKGASFDFPGGWERMHLAADRVSDILAYILSAVTGEYFGAVMSNTDQSQHRHYIPRWRVYAHYLHDHLPEVRARIAQDAKAERESSAH